MYTLVGMSNNSSYNPFVTTINTMQLKPNFSSFHCQLDTCERIILQRSGIYKDKAFHDNLVYASHSNFGSAQQPKKGTKERHVFRFVIRCDIKFLGIFYT